jgi:hypothetical protein
MTKSDQTASILTTGELPVTSGAVYLIKVDLIFLSKDASKPPDSQIILLNLQRFLVIPNL